MFSDADTYSNCDNHNSTPMRQKSIQYIELQEYPTSRAVLQPTAMATLYVKSTITETTKGATRPPSPKSTQTSIRIPTCYSQASAQRRVLRKRD